MTLKYEILKRLEYDGSAYEREHGYQGKDGSKSVNWPSMRELDMMHPEEFTKKTMEFLQ